MADTIIEEIENRLYDNLMGKIENEVLKSMSLSTKQQVIKDHLSLLTKQFFEALNKEFDDVTFSFLWDAKGHYYNAEMHQVDLEAYNKDYVVGEDYIPNYDPDDSMWYFYDTDLRLINFRINYFWKRKCSLKHTHVQKRFYVMNIAKLWDLVSYHKVGMPIRQIVKNFIPDFFYDPMKEEIKKPKKRSKSSHN